ncbi:kinase-like domain-containing protein [Auriculariales sp. MPI-PUGE-AT-0066]|nr:kinase-like domain-containing protein [Auriculariales sp. MPI-PUGE-AT-0066]
MPASSTGTDCEANDGSLTAGELCWVERQPWLEQAGYELRPRYRPGWQPSWHNDGNEKPSMLCEDGVRNCRDNVLDAIRSSDKIPVTLKAIKAQFEDEASYLQFFGQKKPSGDSRNHCVPLLEILRPPLEPATVILVFPRLVPWDVFPFSRLDEAFEFFGQVLEGLAFMHDHHVAHRDASWGNIMMDGLHLYLEPPHPSRPAWPATGEPRHARHVARYDADPRKKPVRYYFIDFGLSARRNGRGPAGQDRSAPELAHNEPYDPFALDVYCIGSLFLVHWLNAYSNVEFLRPLVAAMMDPVPARRPTATDALRQFNGIRRCVALKLRTTALVRVQGYDWQAFVRGGATSHQHQHQHQHQHHPTAASEFMHRVLSVRSKLARVLGKRFSSRIAVPSAAA